MQDKGRAIDVPFDGRTQEYVTLASLINSTKFDNK